MKKLILLLPLLAAASSAHAHTHVFQATLSGANENIPNASAAVGTSTVTLDLDELNMLIDVDFSGLSGNASAAFIFAPTAVPLTGIAGPMSPALSDSGFPLGATFGTYSHLFDLTDASGYNPAFITFTGATPSSLINALNGLSAAFEDGTAYLSIQSSAFPGGEIRGFYTEVLPVPEPTSLAMLGVGGCVLGLIRRRR